MLTYQIIRDPLDPYPSNISSDDYSITIPKNVSMSGSPWPITVRVTDTGGLNASDTFNLTINNNACSSGGCFVATAAYGTPFAEDINYLRAFRDQNLTTNEAGSKFVQEYYQSAPPIADEIAKRPWLRTLTRKALEPIVNTSKWWLKRYGN